MPCLIDAALAMVEASKTYDDRPPCFAPGMVFTRSGSMYYGAWPRRVMMR